MNLYRVYCETHGWLQVISEETPTVCPINEVDTLRVGSDTVLKQDVKTNDEGSYVELSLDNYKHLKNSAIDIRTSELIGLGYTFATKQFSLSANAQTNILALFSTKDHPALTYPISYNTLNDEETYYIANSASLEGMYLTALATKKGRLDSGTALKELVRLAINKAEVDAIIDNR